METGKSCRVRGAALSAGLAWLVPVVAHAADKAAAAGDGIQLAGNSETLTLVIAIVKVVGSLAVVVGLMLLAMHFVKKLGIGRAMLQSGKLIDIIDSRMIAPKKYVTVVKIADECVALGVTDQQITLLANVDGHFQKDGEDSSTAPRQKNRPSFASALERAATLVGRKKADESPGSDGRAGERGE